MAYETPLSQFDKDGRANKVTDYLAVGEGWTVYSPKDDEYFKSEYSDHFVDMFPQSIKKFELGTLYHPVNPVSIASILGASKEEVEEILEESGLEADLVVH